MATPVILIFDSSPVIRNVIEQCAKQLKMECMKATNPKSAELVLRDRRAHLFFLELSTKIPKDVTMRLAKIATENGAMTVVLANDVTKDDILYGVRSGVMDMLKKPLRSPTILGKLDTILPRIAKDHFGLRESEMDAIGLAKAKTPVEKAELVVSKAKTALALPHTAIKLISLTNNENSSMEDCDKVVSSDPATSAMVLKRANCVAFRGREEVTSTREALVRIGMREAKNMAVTLSVYKIVSKEDKSFGFNREQYWIHSLGAAVVCRNLASAYGKILPEEAFLAALLHDLGKIILDDYISEYQDVIQQTAKENKRLVDVENEVFKTDHTSVGAKIAENWRIPKTVCNCIENHHKIASKQTEEGAEVEEKEEEKAGLSLSELVAMGNAATKAMNLGHSGDFFVDEFSGAKWDMLMKSRDSFSELWRSVRLELSDVLRMLDLDVSKFIVHGNEDEEDEKSEEESATKTVFIIKDGLGVLLRLFFQARGFRTEFVEPGKDKPDGWFACDIDAVPEETKPAVLETAGAAPETSFLLTDNSSSVPGDGIHVISPRRDFFALHMVVEKLRPGAADA